MKRIGFQVDDELFKAIKLRALEHDQSVKRYLIDLIKEDLQKEKE